MGNDIVIDEQFRSQIQPLTDDEQQQLEANILADGCRDPLVVWPQQDGTQTLIDGHHRYGICTKHNKAFDTRPITFESREAAADWIDANQLGRRNLTSDQIALIRGRLYNRTKATRGGDRKSKDHGDTSIRPAAERLAKQHNVSVPTIKRDGAFAEAIEKVKAVDPNIEKKLAKGKGPSRKAILEAAELVDYHKGYAKGILQRGTKRRKIAANNEPKPQKDKRHPREVKIAPHMKMISLPSDDAKMATAALIDWFDHEFLVKLANELLSRLACSRPELSSRA